MKKKSNPPPPLSVKPQSKGIKMIELGQKVKDVVTGFTGIATAKIEYGNGCVQFLVVPRMKPKDMEYPKGQYIDVEQLSVVNSKPIKLHERKEPSGGVRQHPPASRTE